MQDLKAQLDSATEEKSELLKLLSAEKAEKRALMPPVDEKTAEISQLAAPARWCTIVPSSQKSDLPIFRLSDTLYKSSLGGTTKRTAWYVCHPSHLRRGINRLGLVNPKDEH